MGKFIRGRRVITSQIVCWLIVTLSILTFGVINGGEKIVDVQKTEIKPDSTVKVIQTIRTDQFQRVLDQLNSLEDRYDGKIKYFEDKISRLESRVEYLENQ